jgi:Spy/CpxP family protein refolding chaperone
MIIKNKPGRVKQIVNMQRILVLLVFMLPFLATAQHPRVQKKKEDIEAQKIAFITKEINLTTEEAQKFWPVYNQCQKEKQELRKQRRTAMSEHKKLEEMTDAEVQKAMETILANKQKELDLEKQYHTKYLAVLPVKKVAGLYKAEMKFKRVLLERLKNSKDHKGGGGDEIDD